MARPERDISKALPFTDEWSSIKDVQVPYPVRGESLLDATQGSEQHVYPYFEWIKSSPQLFDAFAWQFHDCAVHLIKDMLRRRDRPDNVAYVVGYLYRHAIELQLKSIMLRGEAYNALPREKQISILREHSIAKLWNRIRPDISEYMPADGLETVESQLNELNSIDARSDGFRYPVVFAKNGATQIAVTQIAWTSFDNFVWILEGLYGWLESTQQFEQEYRDVMFNNRSPEV